MERFTALGLPTTRDEEYRFTNVGPITATEFVRAAEASVDRAAIAEHLYGDAVAAEIVFWHCDRGQSRAGNGARKNKSGRARGLDAENDAEKSRRSEGVAVLQRLREIHF